jgi:hypothetical protein
MNKSRRLIENRGIKITEQLACSPPKDDEWADIGMTELGGEVVIRAVAKEGEPHFISVSVRNNRGKVQITRISCCEHLEGLAERLFQVEAGGMPFCRARKRCFDSWHGRNRGTGLWGSQYNRDIRAK